MAGHSKWSQIKHKKAKEDAKRGKAFTKLIKEISIAARIGGGDPSGNPRLRTLLEKAKSINMPIDNVQRAIKRGTGELPGSHYEEYTYEAYGPGGIALIIETLSDNKNRTVAELRHIFSSKGGGLAETGAVSWMFHRRGVIRALHPAKNEDDVLELLLDYQVYDVDNEESTLVITCDSKELENVKNILIKEGFTIESAELEWISDSTVQLADEQADKALDLLTVLQDHDDVKNVFTNMA
jgi:YebC/PmpR family DNA-binding regulatory protein